MAITCKIDSGRLNMAMGIFARYATTEPAKMLNRTGLFVAYDAQANTPVTTMGRIDNDMGAATTPIVPTRGVRKGSTNLTIESHTSAAMLISIARMNPKSDFSKLTGNRWAIAFPKTSGKQAFMNAVEVIAERMVRARHSSTGFLKHSWAAIISKLNAVVPRGSAIGAMNKENSKGMTLSGEVSPAIPGSTTAVCVIRNTIGMNAVTKEMGEKHNEAAHRILAPVLQASIDKEFASKMEKAARKGWLERERELAMVGILLR